MTNIRQLNVFIASPGDVPEEREIVREVCEELNKNALCRIHSLRFHVTGWEDAIPAAGRPQEIINKLVEVCDIFVCLFFRRLGTPSGKKKSGTLEEFLLAYDQWKDLKKPHILFYFKDMNINLPKEFNDPQVKKVVKFREKIEENHLLLFDTFGTPETFRKKLRDHLEGWIAEKVSPKKSKKIQTKPSQKSSTTLQIPDVYKNWLLGQCKFMDLNKLVSREKVIQVRLPELFIPLLTDPPGKKTQKKGKDPEAMGEREKPVDIETLVAQKEFLLIEGPAGSGKTTLLKHLALSIIQEEEGLGLGQFLPVLVFLKDLPSLSRNKNAGLSFPGSPWECVPRRLCLPVRAEDGRRKGRGTRDER